MAQIETDKFKSMVDALGQETIQAMASGPQNQQVEIFHKIHLTYLKKILCTILRSYMGKRFWHIHITWFGNI